jgi:hypothetical protein
MSLHPEKTEAPGTTALPEKTSAPEKAGIPVKTAKQQEIDDLHPASTSSEILSENSLGLRLEARVTAATWEIGVAAILQDFAPGEVILLLDEQIATGARVTIQVSAYSFDGEVMFCKPRSSRWEAHVSFDDVDRIGLRMTPRFPVRIPAQVFASVSGSPTQATILDISRDGLGIELAAPLPLDASVAVQSEENIALGEVRHCRALPSGQFRAGVRLYHVLEKDPELAKAPAESSWMSRLGVRLGVKKR